MNITQLSKALDTSPDNRQIVSLLQKYDSKNVINVITASIIFFIILLIGFNNKGHGLLTIIGGILTFIIFDYGYYIVVVSEVNEKLRRLYNINTLNLVPVSFPRKLKKKFVELNQGNYKNTINETFLCDNVIIGKYTYIDKHVRYETEYNKYNKPVERRKVYYEEYSLLFMTLNKKRSFHLWIQSSPIDNNGSYKWTSSLKKFNDTFKVTTNNTIETAKFLTPEKIIKLVNLPIINIEIIDDDTLISCDKELLSMSNTQDINIRNKEKTISVFRDNKGQNNMTPLKELFLQD